MRNGFYILILYGLFSCKNRHENIIVNTEPKEAFNIHLVIEQLDTVLIYKDLSYDLCDLKCALIHDGIEKMVNEGNGNWKFLKAHLNIDSRVEMTLVYEVIEALQEIGFQGVNYQLNTSDERTISYRVPPNLDIIGLNKIGCKPIFLEREIIGIRVPPPLLEENEVPERFKLTIDYNGQYFVDRKLFSDTAYKSYVVQQYRYSKYNLVGIKIDKKLSFGRYFETLDLLYILVNELREEAAIVCYNKSFLNLNKEEEGCIRKLYPKNVIDFQIKDNQHRGCGGMINWD